MAKKFFWKTWLRPNFLTKDVDNDYIAEISTVGNTLRNEDIARQIVKGRSELRYDTIFGILNERDGVVLDALLGGSSVQDGNIHLAPRITGNWLGADPVFDPKAHKITVDASPTLELRTALEDVGVDILGKKTDGGAIIGLVTDVMTGKTDGTVSLNGDIIIHGSKIRVAPTDEEDFGVFFTDANGTDVPLDYPLTENNPKKIVCRVPGSLTPGETYTLKIVTKFSHGTTHMLKDPRTIIYELPIKPV
jgi:hypothetical protein